MPTKPEDPITVVFDWHEAEYVWSAMAGVNHQMKTCRDMFEEQTRDVIARRVMAGLHEAGIR